MKGPLGLFGVVAVVLFSGVADALPPKRIVGATKASPGKFPYMVSLRYGSDYYCGGAIIGPRHIVTAAFCVDGIKPDMYSNFNVATGSVSTSGGTTHTMTNITTHPDYDFHSTNSIHDIAIIELAADIAFDENQASLNLPTELVAENVFATATGWLYSDAETQVFPTELVKVNVKTLRADSCSSSFQGVTGIRESHICTVAGGGVGTCSSGSGGSLVHNGQLIGIESLHMTCADGNPTVYTSVYHHVDWIKKTIEDSCKPEYAIPRVSQRS